MLGVLFGSLSLQEESQPGSFGLGWRLLGAVAYSLYEPGELSHWLCYDDSTINSIMLIIIIILMPLDVKDQGLITKF